MSWRVATVVREIWGRLLSGRGATIGEIRLTQPLPLSCSMPAGVLATFQWNKDGVVIKKSSTADNLQLLLSEVTVSDTGSYECNVTLISLSSDSVVTLGPAPAEHLRVLGMWHVCLLHLF